MSTDIPFARESQDRKQAYAAAEAGIEYYLYQLTRDNDYWSYCEDVEDPGDGQPSPVNLEDPGVDRTWRNVSGTDSKFSIELLPANDEDVCDPDRSETTMLDEYSGSFRIRSTGVSRGVRRSVVTQLRRTSFLDYLYFTDFEASDPNSFASTTDQNRALNNCVKYRAQRNLDDWCRNNVNISFPDWDAIKGPLHTNDDLQVCGTPEFGRPDEEDVIEIHGPAPGGFVGSGNGLLGRPVFHGPVRQPAEHLPVPTSNSRLREAAEEGYIFVGKTEIEFDGTQFMNVFRFPGGVRTLSERKPLPDNGVIYVDNNDSGTCSMQAPRQIDYDRPNEQNCAILIVHGTYPKSMTLGSEVDILIDGNLQASSDPGPVLGLIAQRFVRVKHDVSGTCGGNINAMASVTGSTPRSSRCAIRSSSTTTSAAPRSARSRSTARSRRSSVARSARSTARPGPKSPATPRTTSTTTRCATAARRTSSIRCRPPGAWSAPTSRSRRPSKRSFTSTQAIVVARAPRAHDD